MISSVFPWLSEHDTERANDLRRIVEILWSRTPTPFFYTPHDPEHFARVERNIQRLIPKSRWGLLADKERFLLTCGAWTHDIGMNQGLSPSKKPHEIRRDHVKRSVQWVLDEANPKLLSRQETELLAEIIMYHSRQNDLQLCSKRRFCDGDVVRPVLLAAYLRLADAIEVSCERVERNASLLPAFEHLVLGDKDEITFHWIKSFAVAGIVANHDKQALEVEFEVPATSKDDAKRYDPIVRHVLNEIELELETVERILDGGGLSSFHGVTHDVRPLPQRAVPSEWVRHLPRIVNYVQMINSPSATAISRAGLELVRATAGREYATAQEAREGLEQVHRTLESTIRERHCHNEVRRMADRVALAIKCLGDRAADMNGLLERLNAYVRQFEELVRSDGKLAQQQTTNVWDALSKLSQGRQPAEWTFLLYGCSETVVRALTSAPEGSSVRVYIGEARPKTQYGARNKWIYMDGEAYAAMLKEAGFSEGKITIIPDALIASAMERGKDKGVSRDDSPAIDAVLLGSNGVYYGDGIVTAHAAGHYQVAVVARQFKIPVVLIASAAKISPMRSIAEKTEHRKARWMTSDPDLLARLHKHARITWNPREERVPFDLLAAIVTEFDVVLRRTAGRFGVTAAEAESVLKRWEKQITDYLEARPQGKSRAAGA